jgi:hypothetical protein
MIAGRPLRGRLPTVVVAYDAVGMSTRTSPSPIIGVFVGSVNEQFPEEQRAKLAAHEDAISKTTSKNDGHRARRCALWAIEMAKDKHQSHPLWREVKEAHQVWKDVWFGLEFGIADVRSEVVGRPEPLEDVKIEWTEDAVGVARRLGDEDGWDHAPWEALLVELIGMEGRPA